MISHTYGHLLAILSSSLHMLRVCAVATRTLRPELSFSRGPKSKAPPAMVPSPCAASQGAELDAKKLLQGIAHVQVEGSLATTYNVRGASHMVCAL